MNLLDVATTRCVGPMVGVELAVSVFVDPVLWRLGGEAEARAIQMFAARLGRVMPFWYIGGLALLGAEAFVRRDALTITAASLWAAVILFTVSVLVPINNRLAARQADTSVAETLRDHKRWDGLHRVRVAALSVSLACFLLAHGRSFLGLSSCFASRRWRGRTCRKGMMSTQE